MSSLRRRHGSASRPIRGNKHTSSEGRGRWLRGISTNAEQVAVWVGSFSVCAHLDLAIEAMYCHDDAGEKDVKEGGVVTPSVSNAPVAYGLLDVVSCSCSAERKASSEKRCSSHSAGLSCTENCYCEGEMKKKKKKKNNFLFKVEQNGKYNTSEFAITSTSHTICTT